MDKREYPTGVPCWVDTARENPDAVLDFYGGLFGWEFENVSPEEAPKYHMARLNGLIVAAIGGSPGPDSPPMWNTYVCVESADEAADEVTKAGGTVFIKPFDVGPAGRMAAFTDPEGAWFSIWEPGQTRGAELVNDVGAWVSSELTSRDIEGAQTFYRSVFGWDTGPLGADGMTMFVRPGYGEHLAQKDPQLYDRLEEYQAPKGFADMVAYLVPGSDEQGPPNWGVTFSVEEADASAERVRELGGQVLVEPFDAPWVRMAVVSDPDGAVLTISQFVPPSGD